MRVSKAATDKNRKLSQKVTVLRFVAILDNLPILSNDFFRNLPYIGLKSVSKTKERRNDN